MNRTLVIGGLFATAACSVFNAPDRSPLYQDAGVDTGSFELCDNGVDDDRDGDTDCDDFDCITDAACCGASAPLTTSPPFDAILSSWRVLPAGSSAETQPQLSGDELTFSENTRAIRTNQCVGMIRGVLMRANLAWDACDDCDDYVSMVLSPARDMATSLPADMGVRWRARGRLEIYRGDGRGGEDILALHQLSSDAKKLELAVQVRDVEGAVSLVADLVIDDAPIGTFTVMPLSELSGTFCGQERGRYIAFEGQGDGVRLLNNVSIATLTCPSLSVFEAPASGRASITADDVGLSESGPADFSSGAISQPSFFQRNDGSWDLVAETTNADPDQNGQRIGYAIARWQSASAWPNVSTSASWVPWDSNSAYPYIGQASPTCAAPGCLTDVSAEQPDLANEPSAEITIAWRREQVLGAGARVISVARGTMSPMPAMTTSDADVRVTPMGIQMPGAFEDTVCTRLSHPTLITRQSGDLINSYWLAYVCQNAAGASEVHAIALSASLQVLVLPAPRVLANSLSGLAIESFEIEAIASIDGEKGILFAWAVVLDGTGERSIHAWLSNPQAKASTAPSATPFTDMLPGLRPYPANPVLSKTDPLLAPCSGTCEIRGIGTGTSTDAEGIVRAAIVLSRSPDWTLVPLEISVPRP